MTPMEKDIEKYLGRAIGGLGGYYLKWVCPGFAGIPDRICILPGGVIAFVELKRPEGGVVAPRQKTWADRLRSKGFPVYLVKDHDSARRLCLDLGKMIARAGMEDKS